MSTPGLCDTNILASALTPCHKAIWRPMRQGWLTAEGCYLLVPTKPRLGVELDRDKVQQYHEKYRYVGMKTPFGLSQKESLSAAVPVWPKY